MKLLAAILIQIFALTAWSQANEAKHARVMELEDRLSAEASMYFERRFPNQPFLVKVNITPLRRSVESKEKSQDLPYFEADSEEVMDEWDNLDLPLSYLRNRVVKVILDVSIPDSFDDQKLAEIKQELPVYLRLLPYRDEIRVEKKIKTEKEGIPQYVYYICGGVLLAALFLGIMIRWSAGKIKTSGSDKAAASAAPVSYQKESSFKSSSSGSHGSTEVSGDVTFHDPIKTLEIVHLKINQMKESGTFPTLRDMIQMDELCLGNPVRLGAIVHEYPQDWQKAVYSYAKDDKWLEAYSSFGRIEQNGLHLIESMARDRSFSGPDRQTEDLLIMIWRMGDKASTFLKKIEQDHAFILLSYLPKNLSIKLAKKTFPGAWAKLLEEKTSNLRLEGQLVKNYLENAKEVQPLFAAKLLKDYKQGREILTYLDNVSIDDERDIYETLEDDSFIHRVRPAFFKVFDLEKEKFQGVVDQFPLEAWALVVMNSHRNYVRQVLDVLDDKKKVMFSAQLKKMDSGKLDHKLQLDWKKQMADFAQNLAPVQFTQNVEGVALENEQSA